MSVFFILMLWSQFGYGQLDLWYNIQKIEKLEVSVFFAENSTVILPYYNFHLAKYVKLAKKDPLKKIVIVHKDFSGLSSYRAFRLRDFLVERLGFPKERVDLNTGLPPSYMVSSGEKLVLFLKTKNDFTKKPVARAPAVSKKTVTQKNQVNKKQDYIYINRAPKLKRQELSVSVGIREYSFSNSPEDLFAWSLNARYLKRVSENLNISLDLGYAFSNSSFTEDKEHYVALGLESEFEYLNLNTKVYGRKNWAWIQSDSKFVTVNDLGLHQGLDFKLVRKPSYALTVGAWAELSLSNTISEFASANVLSFQTEITFEWFELNTLLTLYKLTRKYEVFDGDIVGLSLGYKF